MEFIPAIIGPTASGKTDLAIRLAKKINGEVIGLDSRQIYKDIPIGTAQPTVSETSSIKHHLIGVKPVTEIINAGSYAKLVIKCIEKIKSINKVPIICGGSGLYFRAISKGIFDSSRSELEVRDKLELEYENGGAAKMLKRLIDLDFEYSKLIHINNKKRLVRALEIYETTGKSPSEHFAKQRKYPIPVPNLFSIYLDWDRGEIKDNIVKRTSQMLSDGWIEEVKYLLKKHPNVDLHPLDSIGYNQIICHLKGETTLKQLAEQINIKTRQFAVKQAKWFKGEEIDLTISMSHTINLDKIIEKISMSLN